MDAGEVLSRSYYSLYHLWAAEHFAALAKEIEKAQKGHRARFDIAHRVYVTNSIFSAVSFLEAAINELYQDVADAHGNYTAGLDPESKFLMSYFWDLHLRSPLLDKYQIAFAILRKEQFKKNGQLYENASLVVQLRNALIHYKPKTLGSGNEHDLSKRLKNKFKENPLTGAGNPYFPDKCLGYECAAWAVRSAKDFADDFFASIGVEPKYRAVKFKPSPDEVYPILLGIIHKDEIATESQGELGRSP
jgi:hypothetical protein